MPTLLIPMKRNRFILGLTLSAFVGIQCITALVAGEFPKGSPKFESRYKSALAEAKKTGKPVIVVFSASWCGPCQKMKKDVYPSDAVKPYQDKFVWAYLDVDDRVNAKAGEQYGVNGIPHIEVVNAEGKSLGQQVGSTGPDAFTAFLDKALKAAPKTETAATPAKK